MKTQITNLINGAKNVIRDEKNAKYLNAEPATSHTGFAGTCSSVRMNTAARVYNENGESLHVVVRGVELVLPIHKSVSGKSWIWGAELTEEQFNTICGFSFGVSDKAINKYTLIVNGDCTVRVEVSHRQNERQNWKAGYIYNLDEAFVTIL